MTHYRLPICMPMNVYEQLPNQHSSCEATEEELAEAGKPNKAKAKTSSRPVATPARTETKAAEPGSGNPGPMKRHRGKQPDPDKDRQIEELKKASLDFACATWLSHRFSQI